ncbi:NADH-quinone oxidoreductase subunit L [Fluviibacter phosphoraccumulans]|uniref:NADH-quinone oxidoreductase subunit L n=1 Tax=Fluviibacter phosphoraccumulans TaxID=1751046 RepID=A0A679IB37_9RHOO|nr:NADH-quinone oxidoreductase subunit L [Fluviibacter phosphoraccumulans]BBU68979.1 NADH-quinone oxidoreductase subunit L [Fluviibacter phosphoraccumulans]BBU71854.1 NADH-quinone oxidoreductase subunit L [Fluviibacter phosphoraccumulans]BCA64885.1 NADH-quinone oxidoreductase subunit L [Fluviibacter phosphoraccumulans]
MDMKSLYLTVPLAPLAGAALAGLFCRVVPRWFAAGITILGVAISLVASLLVLQDVLAGHTFNGNLYTWATSGGLSFHVGFQVDSLSAMMMVVVTSVSLLVHIYTIGYMSEDAGFNRFFSYISLFTFSMLMLVMSNNFLQLFFGWEAVGLVSYLLIGFWYTRPTAIFANLKAFLVNRVGDFGFILGIGLVLAYFGSLDYKTVFDAAPSLADKTINLVGTAEWSLMTVTCICLFIGAMGKSAQVPLHVWLPDSMEGPTPISALIHAATMVTAGIFMVARCSPMFNLSPTALSFVLIIGATTALFMGFLGMIQNDIKRIVAYSTLSQLGYMTVALGVAAYPIAIFHLMTHAFFKALLFLGAGSVIIGMHHDQDIRNMGGLWKYMPITWITTLIGSLSLIAFPFFAGFYSKDSIIEAVHLSHLTGSGYAMFAVTASVFVTTYYTFRSYFIVFHGRERWNDAAHVAAAAHGHDDHAHDAHDAHGHDDHDHDAHHHGLQPGDKPHESPWVVTFPLIMLAIPSVIIGYYAIDPMLYGSFFDGVIAVNKTVPVMAEMKEEFHGALGMAIHSLQTLPFWLMIAGLVVTYYFYMIKPSIPAALAKKFSGIYKLMDNKYYFDAFNMAVFAGGARKLGGFLNRFGEATLIDGFFVNGSAKLVGVVAGIVRHFQTGYLYQYAFTMIIGVFALLTLWFFTT